MERRAFLAGSTAAAAIAMAPRAFAAWEPSPRNRLFMCGSTAMYSLYFNTQGAPYF